MLKKGLFRTAVLFSCKVTLFSNLAMIQIGLLMQMTASFILFPIMNFFLFECPWTWYPKYFCVCRGCWCNSGYFFGTFLRTSNSFRQMFSRNMFRCSIWNLILPHTHLRHRTQLILWFHTHDLTCTTDPTLLMYCWQIQRFGMLTSNFATILSTLDSMTTKARLILQRKTLCYKILK